MSRQVVLDTETTGLSASDGDRIIEIGCVELLNRKLSGNNLHHYVNPERESHEEALKVHGISNEFLLDKPKFAAIADELLAYLSGAELIIHNAPFDIGFLNAELERLNLPAVTTVASNVIDTLAMAKEFYPGKRNSLDALCERLGVDNSNRTLHGALLDAELLADVYIALTRGQEALLSEIASDEHHHEQSDQPTIDLSKLQLPVIRASATEGTAHEASLRDIADKNAGEVVWQN